MKITYTIWQGSLMKGTLTANSMKEIIATMKDLNDGNTSSLKFEHMVHKIEQVAQWKCIQIMSSLVCMLIAQGYLFKYQHGYCLALLL